MLVDEHRAEETLDPENWEELKEIGHQMVDDMIDHLASVRQRPPAMPINEQITANFMQPLPLSRRALRRFIVTSRAISSEPTWV